VHQQINKKHLEIRGCWGSEVSHFVRALRVLERHHAAIPWRSIGATTYALSELNQALADAEAMRLPKALVKPN
jgi:L-iditol 2-dehydrogenase